MTVLHELGMAVRLKCIKIVFKSCLQHSADGKNPLIIAVSSCRTVTNVRFGGFYSHEVTNNMH